jgi:uncharacterized protein YajQ (UPF0234 family)
MPSFDIVSKVDAQTLDNAVNTAIKEISNRYDLKDAKTEVALDKKTSVITLTANHSMSINTLVDILMSRMAKQGIDGRSLDLSKDEYASGPVVKKELPVRTGVDKEMSKKIVKLIKDSNLKVQAAIMDDMVRVTAKKIDDLQEVIAMLRGSKLDIPLQFVNMKS